MKLLLLIPLLLTSCATLEFSAGYKGVTAGIKWTPKPKEPKLPEGDGSAKSPVLVDPQ